MNESNPAQSGFHSRREEALARLLGRINYERMHTIPYHERDLKLERMRLLLAELGDPQENQPIIHVAGTKGKGSTAAMIAEILEQAGYRTGLFTSPHLESVEQRIVVGRTPCTADQFVALVDHVWPVVEDLDRHYGALGEVDAGPTYFEITTAMALLFFSQQQAEATILEVGLGGRLDSTNVCSPVVSVITSISFDHMQQLGNTLALIAREKAGIIKPGVPVVSGVVAEEPRRVIEQIAEQQGSLLVQRDRDFNWCEQSVAKGLAPPLSSGSNGSMPHDSSGGTLAATASHADLFNPGNMGLTFSFRMQRPTEEVLHHDLQLFLPGRHQADNASVALATVRLLAERGWKIPASAIQTGLACVRLPARVELVQHHPAVIVDAAHNVASVEALLEACQRHFPQRPRALIFATTLEKEIRGMLELLLPAFDRVVLTRYRNNPRSVPPSELVELARELGDHTAEAVLDPRDAWQSVKSTVPPEGLICITGSFFIATELRALVQSEQGAASCASARIAP